MLLLTSNGLSSPALLEQTRSILPKDAKTAALVTTASLGYKENDKNVPRLTAELEALGLRVTLKDIDTEAVAVLAAFDVVELMGGNPFYLLKRLNEENAKPILAHILENGMLIGVSAGSLVLQSSIELVSRITPQMNDDVGLDALEGLSIAKAEILPHYSRFLQKYEHFEETAAAYERETGTSVVRLEDGQALLEPGGYLLPEQA